MITRPSLDAVLMSTARLWSERSTCLRGKVGCVIARDGRIISTGYVGSPPGMAHCLDEGCLEGPDGGCIRTIHSEANAIAYAARAGVSVAGATLFTTMSPCLSCSKLLLSAGIKRVVYGELYRDLSGYRLLMAAGVELVQRPLQLEKTAS